MLNFIARVLSESDGTPSASRVTMVGLASVAGVSLLYICHLISVLPVEKSSALTSALPAIITAMCGLISAPYGVNKVSGIFSDKDKNE